MTYVQANGKIEKIFGFLTKFSNPHDIKIIIKDKNSKLSLLQVLFIAYKLWRDVPVAKIINKKWFFGLSFYTNKHTLDPRPDSETLVEAVLNDLQDNPRKIRILDLGTGTGCLLCAILKNFPIASGVGIDKNRKACQIAQKNANTLGLKNKIKIIRSTFTTYIRRNILEYDIVISNPPYISIHDKNVNRGALHDPKMALYGGKDGLKYYKEIAKALGYKKHALKLFLEIGSGQKKSVTKIFKDFGWILSKEYKDLSGKIRVLSFKKS